MIKRRGIYTKTDQSDLVIPACDITGVTHIAKREKGEWTLHIIEYRTETDMFTLGMVFQQLLTNKSNQNVQNSSSTENQHFGQQVNSRRND